MQNSQKKAKSMSGHGFSQFELTTNLLKNLNKFELTPTAKLVLLELTTHYNEDENGSVVFPSMQFIADTLGVGLTAVKQSIKDLISQGLIMQSKRSKVRGNYNKYLLTPKVQNSTSERSENDCLEQSENDCFMITNNLGTNKTTDAQEIKILRDYARTRAKKSVEGYINKLKREGADKEIIEEYKQAQRKAQRMKEAVKKNIEDLEFARQNRAVVDKSYFDNVRKQIK